MKILLVHNFYQQPGGEDQVFNREGRLLEEKGHRVIRYTVHNNRVTSLSSAQVVRATIWNSETYRNLQCIIQQERPQVIHFHNTFPLISPAAYYAAKKENLPVVQTLHNYRLLCPSAIFFRQGRVCEDCMGKVIPWPGVLHSCYRESYAATGTIAMMLGLHRMLRTWIAKVDLYITLTEFARHKFIKGGIPEEKMVVKPNFLHPDPGAGNGRGFYALFVGRLTRGKGIETLLKAWKAIGNQLPLKIVGDGPLASQVAEAVEQIPGVTWLGKKNSQEVLDLMGEAICLIFPSQLYETFGLVAVESLAKGTPVIGSKIGAIAEIISHGLTGLHFHPGDPQDLINKVLWLYRNPNENLRMRRQARVQYETNYTAECNYEALMQIYHRAIGSCNQA